MFKIMLALVVSLQLLAHDFTSSIYKAHDFTSSIYKAYDFSSSAYKEDNAFYKSNKALEGQCTWFVYGIVKERLDVDLKFSKPYGRHAKHWPELLGMKLHKEPKANAIAVYDWRKYGHVRFVESVEPDTIYYREANRNGNNRMDRHDGILRYTTHKRFERGIVGYLYP